MFSKIFTVLALSASAFAYTTPTTFNVTSDPIYTPALGQLVPVGKPFKVTWGPTEGGTVTLVLLRGPSTNVQPLYAIAESIPNSGSYEWTPKTDLEADTTHYGLQLIKDSNGQYQYSVQFGISNPNPVSSSSSAKTTSAASTSSAEPTTTSYATIQTTVHSSVTSLVTVTSASSMPYTTIKPSTTLISTYAPPARNSTVAPTGSSTPTYSATALPTPTPTGAASGLKVASGLLMGVAGVAAMLL